jgi:hypothetical protein
MDQKKWLGCLYCQHYIRKGQISGTCKAFPKGIPSPYKESLLNRTSEPHDQVVDGQEGNFFYELDVKYFNKRRERFFGE